MFQLEQIKRLNMLEMQVYEYVIQHKTAIPYMRIRELAAESFVSTTTVLHFCKKMGCDGYNEFKMRIKEFTGQQKMEMLPDNLSELKEFLEQVQNKDFDYLLDEAASMIAKADRVLLAGIGNSGCIGQYGARCFTNMGKFSTFISDPFYPLHQIGALSTVGIVISVSGETKEIINIMDYLRISSSHIISITGNEQCTVAKLSDLNIPFFTKVNKENRNVIDYSTQIPVVFLLESLSRKVGNRLSE